VVVAEVREKLSVSKK